MKNSKYSISKLIKTIETIKLIRIDYFDYGLVVFAVILGIYLNWTVQNITVFCAFIYFLLFPQTSKYFARISLLCLSLTAVLFALNQKDRAEILALIAYLALLATILKLVIELRTKKNRTGKEKYF